MSELTCLNCKGKDLEIKVLTSVNTAVRWWMMQVAAEVERGLTTDTDPAEVLSNIYEMLGESLPPNIPEPQPTSSAAKVLEFKRRTT